MAVGVEASATSGVDGSVTGGLGWPGVACGLPPAAGGRSPGVAERGGGPWVAVAGGGAGLGGGAAEHAVLGGWPEAGVEAVMSHGRLPMEAGALHMGAAAPPLLHMSGGARPAQSCISCQSCL